MITSKPISDLIEGRKLDTPIELDTTQLLLLEIARDTHTIRKGVGVLAFLAWVGVIGGILSIIL